MQMHRGGIACDFRPGGGRHSTDSRTALCILPESSDVAVVAEASNGWEAMERARKYQPDVVLLDISMPQLNGLQAAALIKQAAPGAESLVVTPHNSHFIIRAAFAVGVLGFMEKKHAGTELLNAVKDVFSKKIFVSRGLQFSFDSPATTL